MALLVRFYWHDLSDATGILQRFCWHHFTVVCTETNKINSWDIIIDYSQSYNSKENAIFYININKLKNNKNIKQYYQDDLIAMNFGYNYKTNIPKFIDEKLEIVSKKHIIHTNNFYNYSANESNNKKENYNNVKTINKDKNYNNKYDKELKPVSVIFFDTETNGLSVNSSVLSISAAKCIVDYQNKKVKIIDRYERFYYPIENYNSEAISVNGLCQSVITEKRKGARYRRHFKEDINSFFKFIDGIEHFVAHNIEFDRKFINKRLPRQFCTMKSNTNIMKLRMIRGKHKWPKLEEAVAFYKIRNTNTSRFHDSMYDVEMTIAVFEKMLYNSKTSNYIHDFLYKPDYSYINYDYYY